MLLHMKQKIYKNLDFNLNFSFIWDFNIYSFLYQLNSDKEFTGKKYYIGTEVLLLTEVFYVQFNDKYAVRQSLDFTRRKPWQLEIFFSQNKIHKKCCVRWAFESFVCFFYFISSRRKMYCQASPERVIWDSGPVTLQASPCVEYVHTPTALR